MKPGDVIYFDHSELKWNEVYILDNDNNIIIDTYKEWKNLD